MMLRPVFTLVSVFLIVVGLLLLLLPGAYLDVFLEQTDDDGIFVARRLSTAVLGLGAVLWCTRGLPPGSVLGHICVITAMCFLILAATGLHAWWSGVARSAILWAVASEIMIAACFLLARRQAVRPA